MGMACSNMFHQSKDEEEDNKLYERWPIEDPRLWEMALVESFFDTSVAMADINGEDKTLVELGPNGVFAGVYDGHGGPEIAELCRDQLFTHLIAFAKQSGFIYENTLEDAISRTEADYMAQVRENFRVDRNIARVGTCCLVTVIWERKLMIANLGDSRAVIGHMNNRKNKIEVLNLTRDDNVNLQDVRKELQAANPADPDVVMDVEGVWLVKGQTQVSKSIGDAYLKVPEYSTVLAAGQNSILSSKPSMVTKLLQASDKFLICASSGLWHHMSDQMAVDIVNGNPRIGIARRLIEEAIKVAARKRRVTYQQVKVADISTRRAIHDDITVVVIFFDQVEMLNDEFEPGLSIRGFREDIFSGRFNLPGVR